MDEGNQCNQKERRFLENALLFQNQFLEDIFIPLFNKKKAIAVGLENPSSYIAAVSEHVLIFGKPISKPILWAKRCFVKRGVRKLPDLSSIQKDLSPTLFNIFKCHQSILYDSDSTVRNMSLMSDRRELMEIVAKHIFCYFESSTMDNRTDINHIQRACFGRDLYVYNCLLKRVNFIMPLLRRLPVSGLQEKLKNMGIVLIKDGQKSFFKQENINDETPLYFRLLNEDEMATYNVLKGLNVDKLEKLTGVKYVEVENVEIGYDYLMPNFTYNDFVNYVKLHNIILHEDVKL